MTGGLSATFNDREQRRGCLQRQRTRSMSGRESRSRRSERGSGGNRRPADSPTGLPSQPFGGLLVEPRDNGSFSPACTGAQADGLQEVAGGDHFLDGSVGDAEQLQPIASPWTTTTSRNRRSEWPALGYRAVAVTGFTDAEPHKRCMSRAAKADDETRAGLPIRAFASTALFEQWMLGHAADSKGIWLKLAKQGSGVASISKAEAIEVALCHGWIDGQLNPYDERFWLIRFTPRSAKSRWSEINRATATRLMAEGRVSAAGLAQIEAARRDGRWDGAYAPQSKAEVPADLRAALDANPAARAFFATLKGANRYAVLYRIQDARTPATRQARIEKFVGMLARGEVPHPPRPKASKSP